MTIHFAAARTPACSPIAKALARRAIGRAANDNGDAPAGETMLHAALRHFAEHGLGAAHTASAKAEEYLSSGDMQSYEWWLGITRALDRRLAAQIEQRMPLPEPEPEFDPAA